MWSPHYMPAVATLRLRSRMIQLPDDAGTMQAVYSTFDAARIPAHLFVSSVNLVQPLCWVLTIASGA